MKSSGIIVTIMALLLAGAIFLLPSNSTSGGNVLSVAPQHSASAKNEQPQQQQQQQQQFSSGNGAGQTSAASGSSTRVDPLAFGDDVAAAIEDVARIPTGYASESCIPTHRHDASKYGERSDELAANGDTCLHIPPLRRDVRDRMKAQVAEWSSMFQIKGLRLLCWIGRPYSAEVVLRAVRSMLKDRGGVADVAVLQFSIKQKNALMPLIVAMNFPPERVQVVIRMAKKRSWDFKDQYGTVVDGFLHIKIDDDLFYFQPNFELFLFHRYLSQRYLSHVTDVCIQHGNCSQQGREVFYGYRNRAAVCNILSANVVNHVGLTSLHSSLGANEFDEIGAALDWDFQNLRPIARWAALHRSLLRVIASGRNPLDVFDFGLHYFDCDGQPRRWSINAVLFSFDSKVAAKMLADDEDFMSFQHGRLLRWMENATYPLRSCADGRAVTIHASYSGQYTYGWHYPRFGAAPNTQHALTYGIERLKPYYLAIAQHIDGSRRCCKSTGCVLFSERAQDSLRRDSVTCADRLKCTFPFDAEDGRFAALENWTFVDGDMPAPGRSYALAIRAEMTTWVRMVELTNVVGGYLETDTENIASDKFFTFDEARRESGGSVLYFLRTVGQRGSCIVATSESAPVSVLNASLPASLLASGTPVKQLAVKPCATAGSPDDAVWEVRPSPNGWPWFHLSPRSQPDLVMTLLPRYDSPGRLGLMKPVPADSWPLKLRTHGGTKMAAAHDFRLLDRQRMN